MEHEAMLYRRLDGGRVECRLCAHHCRIAPGKRGICGVRENREGTLFTLVYDKVIARHVDPIEKKPLFHVLPGSLSYSIATPGCNFRCRHCQNHEISQMPRDTGRIVGEPHPPAAVVAAARGADCASISCTYTEPTIYFELAFDTARRAREAGLLNLFVSNGFMSAAAAATVSPLLDAINIDIKAFTEKFYRDVCGARLAPVLETVERLHTAGVWIEVTTLIIPGYNDDPGELRQIAAFIAGISVDMPWHVTGFYPCYKLTDAPPTPVATLRQAQEIGLEAGLHYVYEGNRPGEGGENTYCPACGELLIERSGFSIRKNRLQAGGTCRCGTPVAGIFR
ncbi:MAG: AmmeMemoRadiSam system radical SAM enzyme [Deltaproteobacteria bacterium]|nr:AmmeMemoRadiSam system radical SAM enzyme [Candidatus Anaeroferrophillacea bacterium]